MTNVMDEITKLEKAQDDFTRSQFRKKNFDALTDTYSLTSPSDVLADARKRLKRGFPNQDENFAAHKESVAADTSLDDKERGRQFRNLAIANRNQLASDVADIRQSFTEAKAWLVEHADPFKDEKSEATLTRALLENQLRGPADKRAVIDAAQAAADGHDVGALQLYARNFEAMLEQAPQSKHAHLSASDEYEHRGKVREALDGAIHKKRGILGKQNASRLAKVEEWAAELEGDLGVAEVYAHATSGQLSSLGYGGELRSRTREEATAAHKRQQIRQAQTEVDRLEGR